MEHGTRKQYRRGCKCEACKAAEAAYKRASIARVAASGDIPHGTVRGYVLKCRCDACSHAKREYEAARIPGFLSAEFPHGTSVGSKYGCRCAACVAADRERINAWRAAQDFESAEFPHGTVAGYNRGCHCAQCRAAWRNNSDARRSALDRTAADFPHGTVAGYRDWCRCEACVSAITARTSARHTERMESDPAYVRAYQGRTRAKNAARRVAIAPRSALIARIYMHTPEGYEVDHIVPLAKGGAHTPDNLQYLPARANRRKHAKLDYDCASVAVRWQDLFDESSTTISKESRLRAEPKRPTPAHVARAMI